MALAPEDRDAIVGAITDGFKAAGGARPTSSGTPTPTNTGSKQNFASGIDLEKSLGKLGKMADKAGGNLSDLAGAVTDLIPDLGGLGKALGQGAQGIADYLTETTETFQNLSKVGAGFNGDLADIRRAAADTRLPLDTFANLVGNNAAALSAFGGGVNEGVKRFRELSREMFEGGTIDGLRNLGYTTTEANEFLMDNIELIRRQARLENMGMQEQIQAAQDLAIQMDAVARLTGRQAKEIQEELKQRQRNGATQAALRLAEMRGATGAQEAYTAMGKELQQGPAALKNLVDDLVQTGVPMSKATASFASMNAEAYELAKQAAAATKRGDTAAAAELGAKAAAAANASATSERNLTISTMAQVSETAQLQASALEDVTDLVDAMAEHAKKMGLATGTIAERMTVMASLSEKMLEESRAQVLAVEGSQAALKFVNTTQTELENGFSKINQGIADVVGSEAATQAFDTAALTVAGKVDEIAGSLDKFKGAIQDFIDKANSSSTTSGGQSEAVTAKEVIKEENDQAREDASKKYTGGSISPGKMYMVGERGPEIIKADTAGTVLNNAQTNNAMASASSASANGMQKVVEQLVSLNDKTDALLRINTKQVSLSDKQVKVIKGAGNLMRGVSIG